MQISKIAQEKYQIKTKDSAVTLDQDGIEIEGLKFTGPGEYERKGIFVEGILPDGEGVIFTVHLEDMTVGYLGKISKTLSQDSVKSLGDVDILFLPMGGEGSMKGPDSEKTLSTIDPRIVIPIYIDENANLETVLGVKPEEIDVLKIKKAELPVEDRRLVVIS